MAKVLLADDEVTMVQMVGELLRKEGHEVLPYTSGNAALEALDTHAPELVITDLYLDKTRAHGLEILQKARELNPPAVVIVITGFGSIETALAAMKNGAFDYLEKPFKIDELRLCVRRALSYNAAITERACSRKRTGERFFWMKSARCPRCSKAGCCGCCRRRRSGAWATTRRCT